MADIGGIKKEKKNYSWISRESCIAIWLAATVTWAPSIYAFYNTYLTVQILGRRKCELLWTMLALRCLLRSNIAFLNSDHFSFVFINWLLIFVAVWNHTHCRDIHILLTNLTHRLQESSNFLVSRLIANMYRLSRIIYKHIQSANKLSAGHILLFRMYDDNKPNKFKASHKRDHWHSECVVDALYTVVLCATSNSCWKWNIVMHYLCMCGSGYVFVMIKLWRFPQNALEKHFVSRKVEWVSKRFAATAS